MHLTGIKVIDFTTLLPGPYATKMMADMGAEIIKIENPNAPRLEDIFPPHVDSEPLVYKILNGSKHVEQVDLKSEEGRAKISSLLREADVCIEQFRPGTMERLGFGYEQVREINPSIVYCSISSFGQEEKRAGHDINFLARSGIASLLGNPPKLPGIQLGDIVGGSLHAIIGILAALFARERTGEGGYIDISMADCITSLGLLKSAYTLAGMEIPPLGTEILDGGSIYDFYETKDGRFLSIGSIEQKFFKELLVGLGLEYHGENHLFDKDLKAQIRDIVKTQNFEHWMTIFKDLDACVEPVLTMDEVLRTQDDGDMDIKHPIHYK